MDQCPLRIHVFGGLEVHAGDTLLPTFPTQKSSSLFAFLVRNRDRPFHRDVLCGHFWGDRPATEARKGLRTALWRIRSVVEPHRELRGTYLRIEGQVVGFTNDAPVWVDAEEFERCLVEVSRKETASFTVEDLRLIRCAISLYRGDLLEGIYDEWCLLDRERMRQTFLTTLERLLCYHRARRQWLEVIAWGREILRRDPLREHIHRAVMLGHRAMGDRPSALRQYQTLFTVLRDELGIEPMEESRRLYDALRGDHRPLEAASYDWSRVPGDAPRTDLTSEVDEALEAVYALVGRLERARTALRS